MMSASFYGFIGEDAQKIMPSVWWKPELGSFCCVTLTSSGSCNDISLHFTEEQAMALANGILQVVTERATCPVPVEAVPESNDEVLF